MDELDPYFENMTRAGEWRALRLALLRRLEALGAASAEVDSPTEKARIEREMASIRSQVDALLIEEVSQQFAEDSVRVTLARSAIEEDDEDDEAG